LSQYEKDVVLSQVKSIYSTPELDIESVEYVVEDGYKHKNKQSKLGTKETTVIPTLQQGIWGDICRRLIDIYDEYVYRNWLSKLKVFVDESDKFITLQAPNTFIKQWVESTYGETIQKIAATLNVKVILCQI